MIMEFTFIMIKLHILVIEIVRFDNIVIQFVK
jgi:hypothetical protein